MYFEYVSDYSEAPYQGDGGVYGMPPPPPGSGQVPPGGLVVVTEPVQCGPPTVPLPSPYNTPVPGPNAPPAGVMPGVSLQVPFLDTIQGEQQLDVTCAGKQLSEIKVHYFY